MKPNFPKFTVKAIAMLAFLLSACAPSAVAPVPEAAAPASAGKAESAPVEFTGTIEAINGSQWTVNGQNVTVDSQATGGAQFSVGDTIQLQGTVTQTGQVTVSRVSVPQSGSAFSSPDNTNVNDNANQNTNDNTNDNANDNGNSNDGSDDSSSEQELSGVVEAINGDQITIDGVTYIIDPGVDISSIVVGDNVEFEFITNPDGTLTIMEMETEDGSADDGNSNDGSDEDSDDDTDDDEDNSNDDDSDDDSDEDSDDDDDDDNSNGG